MNQRFTVTRIKALKRPGRYRVADTLYVIVEPGGSRHFVQRITVRGRRRDLGLGSFPLTALTEAKDRAWENQKLARSGGDPAPRAARIPTFRAAALAVEKASEWRGARTVANRRAAFDSHCGSILDRRVDQIARADVLRILTPLWSGKRATARSLRSWLRGVFGWALAHGHVSENVVDGIGAALPKNGSRRDHHHAAIPYQNVARTLTAVDAGESGVTVRACLRFIVLTAARSGEVRGARWSEVDLEAREWRVPAGRMKANREHRVPLSGAAMAVLEAVRPFRGPSDASLIFPSVGGRVLDPSLLLKALADASDTPATVHGFRSSFRDWCGEQSSAPHAVCEQALAHTVGSDVERSYARSDLFAKRSQLMDEWAAYVASV